MTKELAIQILRGEVLGTNEQTHEAVFMAIKALKTQGATGDTISRQAAIDAIRASTSKYTGFMEMEMYTDDDAVEAINGVSSAQKHGKWITMSDADGVYWSCSECGEDIPRVAHYNPQFDLFPRLESIDKTNYCPHCGAKMEN